MFKIADLGTKLLICLVAGVITATAKAVWDRIPYQTISKARNRLLKGRWEGVSRPIDACAGIPTEFSITFDFKPGWWRTVRAESRFTSFDISRGVIINDYKGGFYQQRYLTLSYRKRDRGVTGFGAAILELSADGRTLEGRMLGYGSHIQSLFFSKVTLYKKS
jgi:hypothetical protein